MSSKQYDLNDLHLATFEWYAKEWASHFGVSLRWQINVDWAEDSEVMKRYAQVWYDCESRKALIEISKRYDCRIPPTDQLLAEAAVHEVIHVLLAQLADYAEEGAPRSVNLIGIEHEIVQTLVQISMRDHYDTMRARCPLKA